MGWLGSWETPAEMDWLERPRRKASGFPTTPDSQYGKRTNPGYLKTASSTIGSFSDIKEDIKSSFLFKSSWLFPIFIDVRHHNKEW
ncbi:hypothetical protein DXT76_02400 [Halobacillus trueperi]|uniref:Uncharacterized protein n=1 Tax=Halobacillus trueperi TaxID=156205 RepID=A0A3D8VSY4_9BACI|nr:hypothetical protein DXT76_02400 [Halobacillus trueperi]